MGVKLNIIIISSCHFFQLLIAREIDDTSLPRKEKQGSHAVFIIRSTDKQPFIGTHQL